MLIILFLVSCQNLKHESCALKGSKQKGAGGGQEDSEGFVHWGCVHWNPACCSPRGTACHWNCSQIQAAGPQNQLCTPQREPGGWRDRDSPVGHLGPQPAVCESPSSELGKEGKPGFCLSPIEAGCLQPLHLCSPPSPLWKLGLSY